ncbi:MAG: hypothetical protein JXA94_04165 [Parachlamydiales bacterium]|nr:hypothetical protein [Parachlamydiales bacterium]
MFNTYGLHSINDQTFHIDLIQGELPLKAQRKSVYTALKLNNLVFNFIGYLPYYSKVSGSLRMGLWFAAMFAPNLLKSERISPKDGPNKLFKKIQTELKSEAIKPWIKEYYSTCALQIIRGFLESFYPNGKIANLLFDVISTPINMSNIKKTNFLDDFIDGGVDPNATTKYKGLFKFLNYV